MMRTKQLPQFTMQSRCGEDFVTYTFQCTTDGIELIESSLEKELNAFAKHSPCHHYKGKPPSHWASLYNWDDSETSDIIRAVAAQHQKKAGAWISAIVSEKKYTKLPTVRRMIHAIRHYKHACTIRDVELWFKHDLCCRQTHYLIPHACNCTHDAKRIIRPLIREMIQDNQTNPTQYIYEIIVAAIYYYCATQDDIDSLIQEMFYLQTSSQMKQLITHYNYWSGIHPDAKRYQRSMIHYIQHLYKYTPSDVRKKLESLPPV